MDYLIVGTGIAADGTSFLLPGLPGGASLAIKAARNTDIILVKVPKKVIDNIPANWVAKPPKKGPEVKFASPDDPHSWVRIKADAPKSSTTVRVQKDGRALSKNGKQVEAKSPEAHMTMQEFSDEFPKELLNEVIDVNSK